MARRDSDGDSKQGLTVALVIFVLLFLIAGLMAFFGYKDATDARAETAAANRKYDNANKDLKEAKVKTAVYKLAIGQIGEKEIQRDEDYQAFEGERNVPRVKKVIDDEVAKLKGIAWEQGLNRPVTTYSGEIQKLEINLAAATRGKTQIDEQSKKEREAFQKEIGDARKEVEGYKNEMRSLKDDFAKKIDGIDKRYLEVVDQFEKSIIAAETFTKSIEVLKKEKNTLQAMYTALDRDTSLRIKKMEEKMPQMDMLAFHKAKGKIVQLDRSGQSCYINLGRADLAKPELTFSVFGVGQYKPNAEQKGKIEIIDVLGDHLSLARITEVKAPTRDPLLTGDLLYNPAWSPGVQERVAVAGLIDLTGDGRDGTLEFVRNLEKMGVVVDVYLDIKEMQLKKRGDGLTRQTNYLVLGDIPDFDKRTPIKEGDPRAELKLSINKQITDLHEQAVKYGVTIVPARRFMALIGYKLPRINASGTSWDNFLYSVKPANPGAAMEKKEMEKKEMKKE